MESITENVEEQEVTVEVLPQTVNEIIYLNENEVLSVEPNYYIPSEEELEDDENNELYEIGSVDPAHLQHMSLVLDESQSFVLLSQEEDYYTANIEFKELTSKNEDSNCEQKTWNAKSVKKYVCKICKVQCCSKHSFSYHNLTHKKDLRTFHPKKQYICKICDLHFDKAQILSHHYRIAHEPPKLICNICGCPCAHESALLAHYKKHEPKKFCCETCNADYDTAKDLYNHKKTHDTTLLYACNKCDAGFSSTSAVSAHLRLIHAKPKKVQIPFKIETNPPKSCEGKTDYLISDFNNISKSHLKIEVSHVGDKVLNCSNTDKNKSKNGLLRTYLKKTKRKKR